LGELGLQPDVFYSLEVSDYLLIRKGYIGKMINEAKLLRHQTALIVEALVGKGNGVRFVMESWKLDDDSQEMSVEKIREVLKKKRENDALKRLKRK
jgi:hypothetical protein